MRIVMGEVNGVWLEDVLRECPSTCRRVWAAVAYAQGPHPLIEHCKEHKLELEFHGLLDAEGAVDVALLEDLFDSGMRCALVKGRFHTKVIWWEGYGAYIGSANLTENGWRRNVECGVFFSDSEIESQGVDRALYKLRDHIRRTALPLTKELLAELKRIDALRRRELAGHGTADLGKVESLLLALEEEDPRFMYAKAKLLNELTAALKPPTKAHLAWAVHARSKEKMNATAIARELSELCTQSHATKYINIMKRLAPEITTHWRKQPESKQLTNDQMYGLLDREPGERPAEYERMCAQPKKKSPGRPLGGGRPRIHGADR